MKKLIGIAVAMFALAVCANTPPAITNVRASQREGTKLVDIYYDAADADGDLLKVRIEISDNDGAKYSVLSQGGLTGAGGGAGRYLTCSIKINGVDYAVKMIGLNFVVYDTENSRVVDSCEFNTYMGLDPKRIDVQELIDKAQDAEEQMDVN